MTTQADTLPEHPKTGHSEILPIEVFFVTGNLLIKNFLIANLQAFPANIVAIIPDGTVANFDEKYKAIVFFHVYLKQEKETLIGIDGCKKLLEEKSLKGSTISDEFCEIQAIKGVGIAENRNSFEKILTELYSLVKLT